MKTFVLMAGGSGGHLFPAMALAQELQRRGHTIDLMTDHRVASYGGDFPARQTHIVPAATPSIRNPLKFIGAGARIVGGIGVATNKLRRISPDAVVGFGGYPTFPPMVAARLLGIPGVLHEQNAVVGRANRALMRFVKVMATSFDDVRYADDAGLERVLTGNPVRDRVRALATTPYPALGPDTAVNILVFGGSQGARVFSDLVPPAIAALPEDLRRRLRVTQQCRAEDLDRVAEAYRQARVSVDLKAFFDDLPERMAAAHLVIGRAGASTIAELTVLGRPSILVPLPGALDADQKNNALVVERAGGGWIAEQATLSPQSLGTRLTTLLSEPESLRQAAEAARTLGQPRAVEKLADLAERMAAGETSEGRTPHA
ncbi:UDP-N-acetylglucosamine--N-acetylmuramyl-(pentapeptide) pyrophosphoryl-undecaprenol N-acetylglucosamine transferase [Devosia pacifica]|uniref:UDP-N-acetylglucosamine--N-acetylmuramyl-(pentapeptide) pyrophosphoryl-undecaprenol N-acetylglucosamine transferase n=1 Tax=Devosia pacifica TaxID=1335967 RepID=A0A918S008_9HYPH|nr:undecaprenyldiphospho-muramoylpentapeptide beta-N-acetylglucosaminyltransferase [Devosia pacifica]GHA15874.1 UDP-N-acetylglucosamine--N-acetylmuramyl-(pentapeptide) pyrophosphoryl-undecaprenol N-acetylglucosamine transferase [Devosia pacifica]